MQPANRWICEGRAHGGTHGYGKYRSTGGGGAGGARRATAAQRCGVRSGVRLYAARPRRVARGSAGARSRCRRALLCTGRGQRGTAPTVSARAYSTGGGVRPRPRRRSSRTRSSPSTMRTSRTTRRASISGRSASRSRRSATTDDSTPMQRCSQHAMHCNRARQAMHASMCTGHSDACARHRD